MKKYLLEITVFITGAVVMVLELVGTRVLAPYVGGSIIVWTSLIGVILGSLSLGYWQGGRLADRKPSAKVLSFIIFIASVLIAAVSIFKEPILAIAQLAFSDLRVRSSLSTLVLFAPPSILLGMVLPYAVKLKLKSLKETGRTAGNLYAASTVGSIVGTFAAGFFLISYLGNTKILYLLSALLLWASYLSFLQEGSKGNGINLFAFYLLLFLGLASLPVRPLSLVDIDTLYSRVLLEKSLKDERPVLTMRTGLLGVQSAMYLDKDDELAVEYTRYYRLAGHFSADVNRVLMIGGGGYSYPKDFLKMYKGAKIDVIELDSEVTQLARAYFNLVEDPRLTIYHADGRQYLNSNKLRYDAILVDAYAGDIAIPFQLTTKEAVGLMYETLNEGGVVIANIISAIEGPAGKLLRAELATYNAIFPQAFLFAVTEPKDAEKPQNIMLVALKTENLPSFNSENSQLSEYLGHLWTKEVPNDVPILTDDYAPVDQYLVEVIKHRD